MTVGRMIYAIKQTTAYRYESPVPFARHALHLTPRSSATQEVLASAITVDPAPRERGESDDIFGNRVTHVAIETPHQSLSVTSAATVRAIEVEAPDAEATPAWKTARDAAMAAADLGPRSPAHFIYPSRFVPMAPAIRDYARMSFAGARRVLDGGIDLMERIKADFAYDPTATDVTTPVSQAFELRRGVCQDFAHVMIAGLRALGLPAAYVSGYLRTEPPPGKPRLEGADATHAWVSLWCGPEAGWQGLDPTNGIRTATDHIELAFGRDYADIAPVDGVIVASGGHTLTVSVDVKLQDQPEKVAL